ncbi:MAG: alpha/beta fold hydrolase [Streptosporangiales bacterium]|nr:alpha/beta fold hydrolase [Streptosporangiales bacterium]
MAAQVREGTFPGGLPYLAVGSGMPLVYLMGFTPTHTRPAPGLQRGIAMRQVRPFAEAGYRVYLTNRQPGMPAGTTMADIADTHADALHAEFGEPVDLLGHSTGGSIALQTAVDHPEVVRRLVVASTAYALGPVAKRAQRHMMQEAKRGRASNRYLADGFTRNRVLRALFDGGLRVQSRLARLPKDPSDMIAMLGAEDAFDVRDRLSGLRVPALVVCGARDYFWTPEMFVETATRIPDAGLVMYPKGGHAIIMKRAFFRDVLDFLAS